MFNQSVDFISHHTRGSTFREVIQLLSLETAAGGLQLERPQEIGGVLEALTSGEDLVDDILNADDVLGAKGGTNNGVVAEGDSLATDLAETSLVDQFSSRLQVRVSVGNVGLHETEHFDGGGIKADENTIMYLAQSEKLEDLLDLGGHSDDTADSDHKHDLLLWGNEDLVVGLGSTTVGDSISSKLEVNLFTWKHVKGRKHI